MNETAEQNRAHWDQSGDGNTQALVGVRQIIWPDAEKGLVTVISYHVRDIDPTTGKGRGRWEHHTTCQPGVVPASERWRVCRWIQGEGQGIRVVHPRTTGTVVQGSVITGQS
jgi:hypothetical protein